MQGTPTRGPTRTVATRIVVVNQHGDNRGDEAAMRAMVRGIGTRVASPEFVIVHQFADRDSEVAMGHPVTYLPMRISALEYLRLALFAITLRLGRPVRSLAGPRGRPIVDALAAADVVVSAPGGPYFGDLYAGHEIAHWLLVFLGAWSGKPTVLYAPSCGPFRNPWLRGVRRRGFARFERICLREEISARMLRAFAGLEPLVTADSALQDVVDPADREPWSAPGNRLLVVAVRDPGGDRTGAHDRAVLDAVRAVTERGPTDVVLLPQLHGTTHRDAPYLGGVAARVDGAASVQVAAEDLDSNQQRALIAAADVVIAGRYHPAVFAIAAGTPVLVIAYEHKATGVAEAAGIQRWAITLDHLPNTDLHACMGELLDASDEVRALLVEAAPRLRARATETSEVTVDLVPPGGRLGTR